MEVINFPDKLNAGDSIDMTVSLGDYPAGSGWSLKIVIVNASYNYQITSTANGDAHDIDASPLETDWEPGSYKWTAFAVKSTTDRVRVSTGDIEILPDILDDVLSDQRTHAEKVLASIEALIEGKAVIDDFQVNVRGKMLTRYSHEELLRLRKAYRAEVYQERRARKKAQGKTGASLVRVRF